MNDSETDSQSIKALIVFRENGETDNLFVPILCDAIRMAGIDVRCSQKEFWESDTTYDIIHFQWPEEVVGWICEDHDVIRRLKNASLSSAHGEPISYTHDIISAPTTPMKSSAEPTTSSSRKAISWYTWDITA